MGESSVRSGRKKGYVVLFREVAQDDRLSLEAGAVRPDSLPA